MIEIVLTLALLALLAVASAPFYGRFVFSQEVSAVRDEVRGSFSKARLYSMLGKNDSSWGVTMENDRVIFFRGDSFASREASFDEVFSLHTRVTVSGMTEVVFAQLTGAPNNQPTIIFSGNGEEETWAMNDEGTLEEQ